MAHQGGDIDWIASTDSTIVRVHQHGATLPRDKTARNHHSGQCLAATLHWVQTFSNTA